MDIIRAIGLRGSYEYGVYRSTEKLPEQECLSRLSEAVASGCVTDVVSVFRECSVRGPDGTHPDTERLAELVVRIFIARGNLEGATEFVSLADRLLVFPMPFQEMAFSRLAATYAGMGKSVEANKLLERILDKHDFSYKFICHWEVCTSGSEPNPVKVNVEKQIASYDLEQKIADRSPREYEF